MLIYKNKEKTEAIKVSAEYSIGGLNYISGDNIQRGIWLYITPVKVKQHEFSDGKKYQTITAEAFKGNKALLLKMNKKNTKKEETISELVKAQAEAIAQAYDNKEELYKIINNLKNNF